MHIQIISIDIPKVMYVYYNLEIEKVKLYLFISIKFTYFKLFGLVRYFAIIFNKYWWLS